MLYRKLGKTGCDVSVLGFGCMRFPLINKTSEVDIFDPEKPVDEKQTERMIRYGIDHGINYFDTAYAYHGGKGEALVGKYLKSDRDKVMIATKLPTYLVQSINDFEKFINEQLLKLQTDYVDFYLLHLLNAPLWKKMQESDVFSFLEKIVSDGRVRYVGFSFHDNIKLFKEIIDSYDWDMCQIQYNYFDENNQAGKEGLEYASNKGIGVVVMEPLRGGKLTEKIPAEVDKLWNTAPVKRTPAEWALRWVWNHPEVSMALGGMSSMDQLIDNLRIVDDAKALSLAPNELNLIKKVTEKYRHMLKVDCTSCAYCMPCPQGVDIPFNFSIYNDTFMFKDEDLSYMHYNHFLYPQQKAANCNECRECEEMCPQQIEISYEMKNVHQKLGA